MRSKPVKKPQFSTSEGAVAMDMLACGYKKKGSLHHGRVGAGLTLTLDMAVGTGMGRQLKGVKKKRAKASIMRSLLSSMYRGSLLLGCCNVRAAVGLH